MPNARDLRNFIPIMDVEGIPNVVATPDRGKSLQACDFTMVTAPDDFVFADNGLSNMADTDYVVICINNTDASDQSIVSAKTETQFTITGADAADVVTVFIFGKLAGQQG